MNETFLTIAIDFGTAYSGYCFVLHKNHQKIFSEVWGEENGVRTLKTPTCILLDERGNFCKFGYEASMTYNRMNSRDAATYYFFKNFKMELYNKSICRNLMISAANGKTLGALKVFSESLRFLKDHALNKIKEHTSGRRFIASDVTWVLTVPAIWDAAAKQFMREAATQAGLVSDLNSDQLILALEPEAASVWCKQLPSEGFVSEGDSSDRVRLDQSPGMRYIVVDCGGGTIDTTVHEVLRGGFLEELYKASGGDKGGETVDEKFTSFLRDIFGFELWDTYVRDHPAELQRLMYEFSMQKCVGEGKDIYIQCPFNLTQLAQKNQDMASYFRNIQGAHWSDGSIKITHTKLRSFFEESVEYIANLIQAIVSRPEMYIDYILLVGGYASCKFLQREIRIQFGRTCEVLCPMESQLAIAKGAVLFGDNPKIVASRVSTLTYGITTSKKFDESIHKIEKRRVNKTKDYVYCTSLFKKMVQKGQSVKCDEMSYYEFSPVDDDQTSMTFCFYHTNKLDAMYVDECHMKKVASFSVPMPDIRKRRNRRVRLNIKFGFTEIQATATDLTSNETRSIRLDFLTE